MIDQTFNERTLTALFVKGDFRNIASPDHNTFRTRTILAAIAAADSAFGGRNPLQRFHLKKKSAFRIATLSDDLVVRKLVYNLRTTQAIRPQGRAYLVSCLRHFLSEGIPYRVYRLDIRSFYESFDARDIIARVHSLGRLSPLSKHLVCVLLERHLAMGGSGLPRGMALSAVLSELIMKSFDATIALLPHVFFYGRFVDDIVLITRRSESESQFLDLIGSHLPAGLAFNASKSAVCTIDTPYSKPKSALPQHKLDVDYLGYRFSVYDPSPPFREPRQDFRDVRVYVAPAKLCRFQSRICRALVAYAKTGDFALLHDRIRFLTSNFSIVDSNTGRRQLAGIHYGYPLLTLPLDSLNRLDGFLRNAVLSRKGRVFSLSTPKITSMQRRLLLSHSFERGHKRRTFVHFPPQRIKAIQECWLYE